MADRDNGLDVIIDLHGAEMHMDYGGYWWKISAWMVPASKNIPHGVRYSLSLHDKHNTRVFGIDNAHAVQSPKRAKYAGKRHEYDHLHMDEKDKGIPYEFDSFYQLLEDFYKEVDTVIDKVKRNKL